MKKLLCLGALCALAAWSSLATVQAADKPATGDKPKKETKDRAIPYKGKLTAMDKTAKTITVGERVFQVTADTKITKDDKPATLADGTVGDEVRGQYKAADGGQLNAVSVFFGAKAPPKPKKTDAK